jgi:hypothetical protein
MLRVSDRRNQERTCHKCGGEKPECRKDGRDGHYDLYDDFLVVSLIGCGDFLRFADFV